jgi:hypothetical protein
MPEARCYTRRILIAAKISSTTSPLGFRQTGTTRIATRKTLSFGPAPTKNNSMSGILLSRLIEFAVQTAILLGLLWGMIKIQKLDQRFEYNFLGLLGSAALATGLDQILQMTVGRFIGIYFASYITTPIVVTVLLLCIKKVTHAPYVDVLFTVAISYALLFGVNLFILGSLMGDLRPSARNSEEFEIVTQQQEIKKEYQAAIKTNLPAQKANPPAPSAPTNSTKPAKGAAPMTNLPASGASSNSIKPLEAAAPKTNQPAQSTPTNSAVQSPAKPVEVIAKYFAVKGVTENAAKSAVTIQAGTKIYTIFLGETALTQTPDGPIPVRFKDLGADWVVLEINGEPVKLPIH